MAVKFTKGDSIKSTRFISSQHPTPNTIHGHGHGKAGGMPGYINAHQPQSSAHIKGGNSISPHREGYIGKRGESARFPATSAGTIDRNVLTKGPHKGSVHGNTNTGAHKVHTGS